MLSSAFWGKSRQQGTAGRLYFTGAVSDKLPSFVRGMAVALKTPSAVLSGTGHSSAPEEHLPAPGVCQEYSSVRHK